MSGGAFRPTRRQLRATVVTSCARAVLQRPLRRDAEVFRDSGSQEHSSGHADTAGSSRRRHSGSSRGNLAPLPPPACPPVSPKSPMVLRGRGLGRRFGGRMCVRWPWGGARREAGGRHEGVWAWSGRTGGRGGCHGPAPPRPLLQQERTQKVNTRTHETGKCTKINI